MFSNNSEFFLFNFFIQTFITNLFPKFFSTTVAMFIFYQLLFWNYISILLFKKNRRTFLNYFLLYISFTISIVFLMFKLMHQNLDVAAMRESEVYRLAWFGPTAGFTKLARCYRSNQSGPVPVWAGTKPAKFKIQIWIQKNESFLKIF